MDWNWKGPAARDGANVLPDSRSLSTAFLILVLESIKQAGSPLQQPR